VSALLRALRYRPFALLWSGQTMSVVGDKVLQIALGLLHRQVRSFD
jgi:hypothetical protein